MAFKKQEKTQNTEVKIADPVEVKAQELKEQEIIAKARGETSAKVVKTSICVQISMPTFERLKRYLNTEAKRIESQSYIVNDAINFWLDAKGF